jgi:hypothetical protein
MLEKCVDLVRLDHDLDILLVSEALMIQKAIFVLFFLSLGLVHIQGEQSEATSTEKKSNYDQFIRLQKVIYRDISNGTSVTNAASVQTALRRLKEIEKAIHKEIVLADPSGVAKPTTSKTSYGKTAASTSGINPPVRVKNEQTRYSNEIFMFAENYRRSLETLDELKFSDETINLHVHAMLQDYHAFYQKLLSPGVVNELPVLFSLLRRAKESEAEARRRITQPD